MTDIDFSHIHKEALHAAEEAAKVENARLGPEQSRGLDCGFAWVQICPANSQFARYLKGAGIGKKHWDKGWYIWGSNLHGFPTQSISVHQKASQAYAHAVREILKRFNMAPDISVGTRYD